ncbi:DsbA family protein [Rhizobium ruizarguesonis]|uniref:DsbA family protein n=1 Tax=Rhizobium ruizarguesonis TaxID=2081791 RepID=UPI001031F9B0|nr:DsbA family protein [Rhizobium ruizarguesonis]NEJ87601.1 DsbA family protein [Rhizobium ruizarguesonis]TAT70870.1 DsbA family protein [Rhizobium ruizarguesonis]TAT74038.1 DsbA family protein [Rhizobium ruizarguesonis]TAT93131.1 DsbA family protein [Rhizobium ruizarguesonis]TAZ25513.1 DsbA family protein [Rhizobium ruizarguesonis]
MHLTYLYDPLCGWCYGAAPALDKMAKLDNLTVELAPTGLFAGEGARPLDERFAAYAWHNDQRINRLTGQVFSQLYRDQVLAGADSLFDSAPATLGIIAVGLRQLDSEREALKALQIARYIDGRNTSEIAVVADVLDQAGFSDAAARVRAPDEALLDIYRNRIGKSRQLMAAFRMDGVPALLVSDGDKRRVLRSDALFGGFDRLAAELQAA